jgi:hypothetical protein
MIVGLLFNRILIQGQGKRSGFKLEGGKLEGGGCSKFIDKEGEKKKRSSTVCLSRE